MVARVGTFWHKRGTIPLSWLGTFGPKNVQYPYHGTVRYTLAKKRNSSTPTVARLGTFCPERYSSTPIVARVGIFWRKRGTLVPLSWHGSVGTSSKISHLVLRNMETGTVWYRGGCNVGNIYPMVSCTPFYE